MYKSTSGRWIQYSDNRRLVDSSYNLSVYESRDSCLFETLTKIYVFKKSDFSINKYYWSVKTNDGCFYYTRGKDVRWETFFAPREFLSCAPSSWMIISNTSLSPTPARRMKYILKQLISSGKSCIIGNVTVKTQDWFQVERNKSQSQRTEVHDCDEKLKSPDLVLSCLGKEVVIDAYNGTNKKEIERKIQASANHFKNAKIYVFASRLSTLEQMVSKSGFEFAFYELVNGDLTYVSEIVMDDDLNLKIADINDQYNEEYRIFKSENLYWQLCEAHNKILQTLPANKL
jgi:hypothetical protein